MEDILLDIRRNKRGYSFYDRNDTFIKYKNFYNKEAGVSLLEEYFYDYRLVSLERALDLLEKIIHLRTLPTTIVVEDQIDEELKAWYYIDEVYRHLNFIYYMTDGEAGLPKLREDPDHKQEYYLIGERFVSEDFQDKAEGLLILQELLDDGEIDLVQFFDLKNEIESSTLPASRTIAQEIRKMSLEPIKISLKNLSLN